MASTTSLPGLADEYAEKITPLIPLASRAYGSAGADSPQRRASDTYNELLLEYKEKGGNIAALARELGVADVTLRRRLRVAKSGVQLGRDTLAARGRGKRDPELIRSHAERISGARGDQQAYREAIKRAYNERVSLYALAEEMGVSYYSLYVVLRSAA